jgi:HAD superfamily hydrolase (TIGR01549 family)
MKTHIPLLLEIKKDIDQAKIISFDVFDTLLLRPYLKPTDLFLHIEKIHNLDSFMSNRIKAENSARLKNPSRQDITFDEIYEEIDDLFKPYKQVELDLEMQVLMQNPQMKQIYDYAKSQNKKIIIASDMYLPSSFISKALQKNGFCDHDKIYISSELGKTKYHATLYQHIIDDLNVCPNEILHIGDNIFSDYQNAKKLGICCVHYQQVIAQFLESNSRMQQYLDQAEESLGRNIFIAILALRYQKKILNIENQDNYFFNLGYEYAGALSYGFARWIYSKANEMRAGGGGKLFYLSLVMVGHCKKYLRHFKVELQIIIFMLLAYFLKTLKIY